MDNSLVQMVKAQRSNTELMVTVQQLRVLMLKPVTVQI